MPKPLGRRRAAEVPAPASGLRTLRHRLPPFRCHRDRRTAGTLVLPGRSLRSFARCLSRGRYAYRFARSTLHRGGISLPASACARGARRANQRGCREIDFERSAAIGEKRKMTDRRRARCHAVRDALGHRNRGHAPRRGAARAGLRRLDEARARHAVDARPGRLHDARVRDRPPGRRHLALRLARSRRQRGGDARRVPRRRAAGAARLDRALGRSLARDAQRLRLQRGGRRHD